MMLGMNIMSAASKVWTAEEFLATDQRAFGDLWRYELVDGQIVGQAAPAPNHGAILSGLIRAIANRMAGLKGKCRPEIGSGATPKHQQRANARIPDATIRCGANPRVLFEVVSPSELRRWRDRDYRRTQLQDVPGVQEIVEIYQSEPAAHIYRRAADGSWSFEALGGGEAVLELRSVELSIPLDEIYEFADGEDEPDAGAG
jgi:Uma2 family endonuclease